jgi:phosphoribosylanthranilate isomerase
VSHTRIKFCGLTRPEDVRLAVELGVDYVGLVFAPASPRRLSHEPARRLRALVPEEIAVVALVMDNPREEVQAIIEDLRPDLLQFHGSEDNGFCSSFGIPFLRSVAMGADAADAGAAASLFPSAYGLLLDGHGPGEAGGSGRRFDWTRTPGGTQRRFFLAGGISADNVGVAIRTARPWGVDVSSGIEQAPGIKDGGKMRFFVEESRRADSRKEQQRGSD